MTEKPLLAYGQGQDKMVLCPCFLLRFIPADNEPEPFGKITLSKNCANNRYLLSNQIIFKDIVP